MTGLKRTLANHAIKHSKLFFHQSTQQTFNKRQCLKFDNVFVAIPRRSIALLLLLQSSLVIRIDLVDKFTRHVGVELLLLCLFNDMYQNGTFFNSTTLKHCSMCYVHILRGSWLVKTKYTLSASMRNAGKYRYKQLPDTIFTAAWNTVRYYRITSIPVALYAPYRISKINKSCDLTEYPVELIYSRNQRTCTNIWSTSATSVAKLERCKLKQSSTERSVKMLS